MFCRFGGVGGKGGDVIAVATPNITLEHVYKQNQTKRYIANNGRHATHNFIIGPPGEDLKIPVPVGVSFVTELGKRLGRLKHFPKSFEIGIPNGMETYSLTFSCGYPLALFYLALVAFGRIKYE